MSFIFGIISELLIFKHISNSSLSTWYSSISISTHDGVNVRFRLTQIFIINYRLSFTKMEFALNGGNEIIDADVNEFQKAKKTKKKTWCKIPSDQDCCYIRNIINRINYVHTLPKKLTRKTETRKKNATLSEQQKFHCMTIIRQRLLLICFGKIFTITFHYYFMNTITKFWLRSKVNIWNYIGWRISNIYNLNLYVFSSSFLLNIYVLQIDAKSRRV